MLTTTNFKLKKPEGTDVVNIDDFNYNADILDTKIKEIDTKASNIKVPVTSVNDKTGKVVLDASDVGAVSTTRKVNNKDLSKDITLAAADIKTKDGKTLEEFKTSTNASLAEIIIFSDTEPTQPKKNQVWIDTNNKLFKYYSGLEWIALSAVYSG